MKRLLLSLSICAAVSSALALELGSPFVDGAVLQREKPVRVWGRAEKGERVTVTFAGQVRTGVAGSDGRWEAVLTPMAADATLRELVAEGASGRLVVRDVAVGEVWLVVGQVLRDERRGCRAEMKIVELQGSNC